VLSVSKSIELVNLGDKSSIISLDKSGDESKEKFMDKLRVKSIDRKVSVK
jgi:hypothetical protein